MDDILKFFLIAGVILIGVLREANKNKSKKTQNQRPHPSMPPTTEAAPDDAPFPETWGKMFPPQDVFQPVPIEKPSKQAQKEINARRQAAESRQTVAEKKSMQASPSSPDSPRASIGAKAPACSEKEDFTIHSAEEARRAIIWGEILQRKY